MYAFSAPDYVGSTTCPCVKHTIRPASVEERAFKPHRILVFYVPQFFSFASGLFAQQLKFCKFVLSDGVQSTADVLQVSPLLRLLRRFASAGTVHWPMR
eukprot:3586061-Amphidinium_carterae.1